ncbi:MAG: hypothetical protein US70_C0005G0042 [Parcubacteria group bacterium GW2011_GWD2_38_11]|nr:MAG: hypothetical protein US70_C0005G0042 [Parcubacteria group bacterium GW2011_GWD2_38_11]
MGNDYDDLYRRDSGPEPERETKIHLEFECGGCHRQVDKWYTRSVINNTPGCEKFCLPCLSEQDHQ